MREDMGDGAAGLPVGGKGRGGGAALAVGARCPGAARHLRHAAEKPAFPPLAQEHGARLVLGHEGRAEPHRLFLLRRLARVELGILPAEHAAGGIERTERAGRPARRADRRAEVHHGLREIARPVLRRHGCDERAHVRLCRRQGRLDGVETGDDPLDIAVEHGALPVEGDGGDGGGRIVADAGQGLQSFLGVGKDAAVPEGDRLGAFFQVAGARIIAEPRPGLHDVLGIGLRKVRHGRPARGEEREIGFDRLHGRLLQHDLGKPDPVGVGPFAARGHRRAHPPGQVAMVPVVPGKNEVGGRRGPVGLGHVLPERETAAHFAGMLYNWPSAPRSSRSSTANAGIFSRTGAGL